MAKTPKTPKTLTRKQLLGEDLGWLFDSSFLVHLTLGEQDEAIALMERRRFKRGAYLREMGRSPEGVDLIISGKATVEVMDAMGAKLVVANPGPGQLVGETAQVNNAAAAAYVQAAGAIESLWLSPQAFGKLYGDSENFRRYIDDLVEIRARWAELMGLLTANPHLRTLGRGDRGRLLSACTVVRPSRGQRVIRAGDAGEDVFILVRGSLEVLGPKQEDGSRASVKTFQPGELVGEVSLLMQSPRTADVVAGQTEDTEFLKLAGSTFVELVNRNPMLRRQIGQAVAAMGLDLGPGSRPVTEQAVPFVCGAAAGQGATTLAYGIAGALRDAVDVVLVDLDGEESIRRLGFGKSAKTVCGIKVHEAKVPGNWRLRVIWPRKAGDAPDLLDALRSDPSMVESNQYTLFTGRMASEEARDTLRRANEVIYVRYGDQDMADLPLQSHHHLIQAKRLKPDVVLPIATNRRTARMPDDPDSVSAFWDRGDLMAISGEGSPLGRTACRVTRILRGRSVGVALGGGGAFGYAHIGLLRVMREAGIPVDFVSGTSFGSLVGAQYVAGDMEALDTLITKGKQLLAITMGGLAFPQLCGKYIDRLNGKTMMNETEVPFYPVSLNLITGREYVLPGGTLGDAIHSASCLPGMFPAWRLSPGTRLVDGGLINNVPVSTMFDVGADFILGSNIVPPNPEGASVPFGNRSLATKIPIFGMLERIDDLSRAVTSMMSQNGRDRAVQADFLFDLQLEGFEVHDFHKGAQISRLGYEQARLMIEDIKYAYDNDVSIRF